MIKSALVATVFAVGVVTAASAFPVGPSSVPAKAGAADVITVKDYKGYKKGKGKWHGNKYHPHGAYIPGHRYKSAPKHWRHYSYRPRGWDTLGCIMVGPLWYCP